MAEKEQSDLIGYDPLAWLDEDEDAALSNDETIGFGPIGDEHDGTPHEHEEVAQASGNVLPFVLETELGIQQVGRLRQQLTELLNQNDSIELDASAVKSVDTAVLQLLMVLKKAAVADGKAFVIDFPSEPFIDAAGLLGLSEMLGVDQADAGLF